MRSRMRFFKTFALTMSFFVLIFYVFSSTAVKDWYAERSGKDWNEELVGLKVEINELKELQGLYLDRVKEHAEKSMVSNVSIFSKRHKKLAMQNQKMADSIAKDINLLRNRSERLTKKQLAAQ